MPNTYTQLLYHVVYATRRREPLIRPKYETRLRAYIAGILKKEEAQLLEAGGMADHLHLVLRLKARHTLADIIRVVKSKSAIWFNELEDYPSRFYWQRGYSAFTVSTSQLERVRAYVRGQKEHHAKRGFQQELRALLRNHDVQFEEQYLWE